MKRLLAFFLLAVPTLSHAKTAKALYDECKSTDSFGICLGYIEGVFDLEAARNAAGKAYLVWAGDGYVNTAEFVDDNYNFGQAEKVFVLYLDAHPEEELHPAYAVLRAACLDHNMLRITKREPFQQSTASEKHVKTVRRNTTPR